MTKRTVSIRILSIGMAIAMLFSLIALGGCYANAMEGRTFEVDGWTLFQFNRSDRPWSREVRLVRLNNQLLVEDGVLTIPNRVGRHNIDGFWHFHPGPKTRKIVIPAGIRVNSSFWDASTVLLLPNLRYVELLCRTFENIESLGATAFWRYYWHYSGNHIPRENPKLIIIPDGSTKNFIARIEFFELIPEFFNFIEKSQREIHSEN